MVLYLIRFKILKPWLKKHRLMLQKKKRYLQREVNNNRVIKGNIKEKIIVNIKEQIRESTSKDSSQRDNIIYGSYNSLNEECIQEIKNSLDLNTFIYSIHPTELNIIFYSSIDGVKVGRLFYYNQESKLNLDLIYKLISNPMMIKNILPSISTSTLLQNNKNKEILSLSLPQLSPSNQSKLSEQIKFQVNSVYKINSKEKIRISSLPFIHDLKTIKNNNFNICELNSTRWLEKKILSDVKQVVKIIPILNSISQSILLWSLKNTTGLLALIFYMNESENEKYKSKNNKLQLNLQEFNMIQSVSGVDFLLLTNARELLLIVLTKINLNRFEFGSKYHCYLKLENNSKIVSVVKRQYNGNHIISTVLDLVDLNLLFVDYMLQITCSLQDNKIIIHSKNLVNSNTLITKILLVK